MTSFGQGSEFAAQCPRVATPDGWRVWLPEADGPIPDAIAARSQALAADASIPLGVTESYPLPGVTALIRVEPRVWGRDEQGNLVQGCFRAGGVYLPSGAIEGAAVTPPSKLERAVGVLTAASLVVGIVGGLAAWSRS